VQEVLTATAVKKLAAAETLEANVTKDLPRDTAAAVNGHFALSVSHKGPDIPRQELERIFEKFQITT
jgi:hypothetical protein